MRGIFKSLFYVLLIAGIFITLSVYMDASAKAIQSPVAKALVPGGSAWNPIPPPIEKPKDDGILAGNAWNPIPPPIEKPKDDDGIASNAWNPIPPPIEKPKDDGIAFVGGSAWNPIPPPIEKPKDDGIN